MSEKILICLAGSGAHFLNLKAGMSSRERDHQRAGRDVIQRKRERRGESAGRRWPEEETMRESRLS